MARKTLVLAAMVALALLVSAAVSVEGRQYWPGDDVPTAKEFYKNGYKHSPAFLTPPRFPDSKTFSTVFGGNDPWDK